MEVCCVSKNQPGIWRTYNNLKKGNMLMNTRNIRFFDMFAVTVNVIHVLGLRIKAAHMANIAATGAEKEAA